MTRDPDIGAGRLIRVTDSPAPNPLGSGFLRVDREGASLRAVAELQIRNLILDGAFPPGHRLHEVDLSQKLDISRGPIREALQRLATEGLITYSPFRGMSVRSFDGQETRDLYEARIALESYAARLTAERIEPRGADDLRAMMEETVSFLRAEPEAAYPAHLDFHEKILSMSQNPPLIDLAHNVMSLITVARLSSARRPSRSAEALSEHEDIAAAVYARDGAGAQALMAAHIERSMNSALAAMSLPTEKQE